jgi:hypothetical protein
VAQEGGHCNSCKSRQGTAECKSFSSESVHLLPQREPTSLLQQSEARLRREKDECFALCGKYVEAWRDGGKRALLMIECTLKGVRE